MNDRTFTVQEICERYRVTQQTVLSWINSGQLRAINVGRRMSTKKPRWRVTQQALDSFEMLRASTPPPLAMRRRRRLPSVIEFIK
jgi:excisionase family DNA binding protein